MEKTYNDLPKKELITKIHQLKFAAVDLNLYLDNHPGNKRALDDYNTITRRLIAAIDLYESKYGPQTNFGGSESKHPWAWVDEPWPWEIGE